METYWLTGITESKLMRKRTMTKRDQNALYQQNKNSPSFTRLIRESPKVPRHRLYVTQTSNDFARTPPLNPPPPSTKEKRSVSYHQKPLHSSKKPRNQRKSIPLEMSDYTAHSFETQKLLSTVSTIEPNGNELNIPMPV